jgi:hypothetical protein
MSEKKIVKVDENFGKSLVRAAEEKQEKERSAYVIGLISGMMYQREICAEDERRNGLIKEFFDEKINAVRKGEFEFTKTATHAIEIRFLDHRLNRTHREVMGV